MKHAGLLALATTICFAALAAPSAGSVSDHTTITIGSFHDDGTIQVLKHPKRFRVNSADSYVVFKNLKWKHWGSRTTSAKGRATTCSYGYGCTSADVTLRANSRSKCDDDYQYRAFSAVGIPNYGGGRISLPVEPLGCARA